MSRWSDDITGPAPRGQESAHPHPVGDESAGVQVTESEKRLCMLGLRPTAAGPAGLVDAPLTALDATRAADRPVALGASPSAAGERAPEALRGAGRCAEPAFQFRDDLAGAFGDPALTERTVERMRAALERAGARAVVESQIVEPANRSPGHSETMGAGPAVRREFAALVQRASRVTPLRSRGDV